MLHPTWSINRPYIVVQEVEVLIRKVNHFVAQLSVCPVSLGHVHVSVFPENIRFFYCVWCMVIFFFFETYQGYTVTQRAM